MYMYTSHAIKSLNKDVARVQSGWECSFDIINNNLQKKIPETRVRGSGGVYTYAYAMEIINF